MPLQIWKTILIHFDTSDNDVWNKLSLYLLIKPSITPQSIAHVTLHARQSDTLVLWQASTNHNNYHETKYLIIDAQAIPNEKIIEERAWVKMCTVCMCAYTVPKLRGLSLLVKDEVDDDDDGVYSGHGKRPTKRLSDHMSSPCSFILSYCFGNILASDFNHRTDDARHFILTTKSEY